MNSNSAELLLRRSEWVILWLFNLPVPVLLGSGMTNGFGKAGMAIGSLLALLVGDRICRHASKYSEALRMGAFAIALSQLLPILHIWIGMFFVLGICREPLGGEGSPSMGFFLSLIATLGTAGSLMVSAYGFGRLQLALCRRFASLMDRATTDGIALETPQPVPNECKTEEKRT